MNLIWILLNVSNLQLVENLHHFGPIYNLSKKIQSFGPKYNLLKNDKTLILNQKPKV